MEANVAAVTVTVVEPEIQLRVTVIGVLPIARPVTSPCVPVALLTEAIVLFAEVQLTWLVKSWVLPSLKLPVAVSCRVVALAIEGAAGRQRLSAELRRSR